MFIGITIGFFFGAATGFILFALISAAKENDDLLEDNPLVEDSAEDQTESEDKYESD